MGRLFLKYLEGRSYACKFCNVHLALEDHIISKTFHCVHGVAYLFSKAVNVTLGKTENRIMSSGMHAVVDVFCVGCGSLIGWKYIFTYDKAEKYKEGKFVFERYMILDPDGGGYVTGQEIADMDEDEEVSDDDDVLEA